MTSTQPVSDRRPSLGIDDGAEPITLTGPNHTLRRCPLHWCTDLAATHVDASNYDAASMRRPTENKESQ
jgi:hypothetical protein